MDSPKSNEKMLMQSFLYMSMKKVICENRFNLAWLSQLNGTTTKFAGSLASDLFLFGFEGAATLPQTLSKMFRNRYLLSLDLTLSTQHRVDVSVF